MFGLPTRTRFAMSSPSDAWPMMAGAFGKAAPGAVRAVQERLDDGGVLEARARVHVDEDLERRRQRLRAAATMALTWNGMYVPRSSSMLTPSIGCVARNERTSAVWSMFSMSVAPVDDVDEDAGLPP